MTRLVVENAGLIFWPVVSLIIFAVALVFMLAWIFRPGSGRIYKRVARLAVDDDNGENAGGAGSEGKERNNDNATGDAARDARSAETRNGGN